MIPDNVWLSARWVFVGRSVATPDDRFGGNGMILRMLLCAAAMVTGVTLGPPIQAQQNASLPVLKVGNDRGGKLRDQVARLDVLRVSGQPVEITGNICFSTCTMYLGLPQTCVSPATTFGFHGPSSYGRPLDQDTFERASRIIVAHYPPVLHDWYMAYGRHERTGLLRVTGAHLIRIGAARPCSPRLAG